MHLILPLPSVDMTNSKAIVQLCMYTNVMVVTAIAIECLFFLVLRELFLELSRNEAFITTEFVVYFRSQVIFVM